MFSVFKSLILIKCDVHAALAVTAEHIGLTEKLTREISRVLLQSRWIRCFCTTSETHAKPIFLRIVQSGGPFWDVELGRRDSLTASKSAANNAIPKPTFNVPQLTASFKAVGLNEQDVVALSGTCHSYML
jgi:hypothetical protein